jgi:hypothetical protein
MKHFFLLAILLIAINSHAQFKQSIPDRWEGITLKTQVYQPLSYKDELYKPYIGIETGYTILDNTLSFNGGVAINPNDGRYLVQGSIGIKLFKPRNVDISFIDKLK